MLDLASGIASRIASRTPASASPSASSAAAVAAQRVVCVLGMHRSGTSVVALILRSLLAGTNAQDTRIHAIVTAASARAIETQAALDVASGETGWRVTSIRPADSMAVTGTTSTTPLTTPAAVSRLRGSIRNYLADHQDLAIAYRRVRRIVRRSLRLGP